MTEKEYKLKNYTTKISAEKTIAEIEQMLSSFGASHVLKEYDHEGDVKAVFFRLDDRTFRLPSKAEGVETLFRQNPDKYRGIPHHDYKKQAVRTTWRMIKDWIHAQLSLVATQQAQIEEVMLPYMWNGEKTLYDMYREGKIALEDKSTFNPNNKLGDQS